MCESQTTQTTSIPGASDFEMQMRQLFSEAIMPQMIQEAGYMVNETQTLSDEEIQLFEDYKQSSAYRHGSWNDYELIDSEFGSGTGQRLSEIRKKMRDAGHPNDVRGSTVKMIQAPTPEIRRIAEEKGVDSEEYKQAIASYEKPISEQKKRQQEIMSKFQENSLKFLKGEFALSDAEQEQMSQFMAPTREAVERMYDGVGTEIDKFEEQVTKQRQEYDQVQEQLLERGIEKFSQKTAVEVLNRAAATGRDPADPDFQNQIAQEVAEYAGSKGLELRTQQMLRNERQTADIAQKRLGLAESRGMANVGIEDQIRNMRMSSLTGGGGMAAQSANLVDALNQARIANLQSVGSGMMGQQNLAAQLRMAQQTTTQTATPSMLEVGLGAASAGMGAYTGFAQADAMRTMANSYAGAGGGDYGGGYGTSPTNRYIP